MQRTDERYAAYVRVLENHLKPAMGCTEPIAIAYAAALCAGTLGAPPEAVEARVSGNILKNAKAVTVPNTGARKGIDTACAAGIVSGHPERELEVLTGLDDDGRRAIDALLQRGIIRVSLRPQARLFDIEIEMWGGGHRALCRIADRHTNVVRLERDAEALLDRALSDEDVSVDADEARLTIADIYDFAESCDTRDVSALIERQIEYNTAIAREGVTGRWGAAIGRILLDNYGENDVRVRARAMPAAGSDARMAGCEMPVIINSGSGNQGLTVSLPVIEYARDRGVGEERLLRALVLSNLTAIHLKARIGCLSAYCGAVSAGSAAGAGIAYICGEGLRGVEHTIVNTLSILSGTICDGAKSSCAAKIASSVEAGILGYQMVLADKEFRDGEGIVKKGVENTIISVGRLGHDGMRQTDEEILRIMLGQ